MSMKKPALLEQRCRPEHRPSWRAGRAGLGCQGGHGHPPAAMVALGTIVTAQQESRRLPVSSLQPIKQ